MTPEPAGGEGTDGQPTTEELHQRDTGDGEATRSAAGPSTEEPADGAPPSDQQFGWRGWLLVGVIVVSFFVVPWTIIALPQAQSFLGSLGLGLRDAYLVLPMLPALLLGAVAIWTAVQNGERRQYR